MAFLALDKRRWTEGYLEILIALSTGKSFNKRNQTNIFLSLTKTVMQQPDFSDSLHNVCVQGSIMDEGK